MSQTARGTPGKRVFRALGFALLALLVAAPDYWTYEVLSSHGVVAGVSILIVSYVAFSCALWLLCVAARALGVSRLGKPDDSGDVLWGTVDHDRNRQARPRQGGRTRRRPRTRQGRQQPRCGSR